MEATLGFGRCLKHLPVAVICKPEASGYKLYCFVRFVLYALRNALAVCMSLQGSSCCVDPQAEEFAFAEAKALEYTIEEDLRSFGKGATVLEKASLPSLSLAVPCLSGIWTQMEIAGIAEQVNTHWIGA